MFYIYSKYETLLGYFDYSKSIQSNNLNLISEDENKDLYRKIKEYFAFFSFI